MYSKEEVDILCEFVSNLFSFVFVYIPYISMLVYVNFIYFTIYLVSFLSKFGEIKLKIEKAGCRMI